jgi:DNA-directed RNA polymerase subunit N (RpoN/RPB10)
MSCKCENLEDKVIKYNRLLAARKKRDEIFEELNIHNECCRKKLHDMFMKNTEETKLKNYNIDLILVSKKARPATLLTMLTDNQITKIKRDYPDLIYTFRDSNSEGKKSYFVSYKKLPIKKKGENDHIYTGRILGYQNPIDVSNSKPRYFIGYYAISENEKLHFYSEGIRFKNHYKSNKAKFSKALKPYGYTIEEVIKKNPRYKN